MVTSRSLHVLFLLRKVDCNDGIATYCRTLASGLQDLNVSVEMISGTVSSTASEVSKRSALEKTLRAWHVFPGLRKIPSPVLLIRIAGLLRISKPDIINVHGLGMLIWGKALSLLLNLPLYATYHPSASTHQINSTSKYERSLSFVERSVLRLCAPIKLVVLSEDSKKFLTDNCPSVASRVCIVPGGTDESYFRRPNPEERSDARANLGLASTDICILNVARLATVKRQEVIIEAARLLRNRSNRPRYKFFFVGSGGDEKSIKECAFKDVEDEREFVFIGFVEDPRPFYWASDIFVLPSLVEGFPLAVVEAMLCGLPVIRTPCGGSSEQILPGVTGILVPFDDPKALSEAIEGFSDNRLRASIGENAFKHAAANYTQKAFCNRILSLYDQPWAQANKLSGGQTPASGPLGQTRS